MHYENAPVVVSRSQTLRTGCGSGKRKKNLNRKKYNIYYFILCYGPDTTRRNDVETRTHTGIPNASFRMIFVRTHSSNTIALILLALYKYIYIYRWRKIYAVFFRYSNITPSFLSLFNQKTQTLSETVKVITKKKKINIILQYLYNNNEKKRRAIY